MGLPPIASRRLQNPRDEVCGHCGSISRCSYACVPNGALCLLLNFLSVPSGCAHLNYLGAYLQEKCVYVYTDGSKLKHDFVGPMANIYKPSFL